MSGRASITPPAVVPFARLEGRADRLRGEIEKLLAAAQDQHDRICQAEEEACETRDLGPVFARRYAARDALERLERHLRRAHAALILPSDPRYAAARQIMAELDQGDSIRRAA